MFHKNAKKNPGKADSLSRRRLLKRGSILGGASALASVFGFTPFVAHAATSPNSSPQIVALSGPEAQQYISVTLSSPQYKSFQTQQSNLLRQGFTARESETTALLIITATEKMVAVRIPIAGGAGYSGYQETFPYGSFTAIDTLAGLFETRPDHNIAAHIWRQGKEILNAVITPDGKHFVQGYIIYPNGKQQTVNSAVTPSLDVGCVFGAFLSCLVHSHQR